MADRYWARIEFPAHLIDDDVKAALEREGVSFYNNNPVEPIPDSSSYTVISVDDGIFCLSDPEVAWGQFEELENLLRKKNIPFDRESGHDYQATPEAVIFRPATKQDLHFLLCDGNPIVEVAKIRELLAAKSCFRGGSNGEAAALAVETYLDENFAYPPLADFVKEIKED
jgi:hypothetical protein